MRYKNTIINTIKNIKALTLCSVTSQPLIVCILLVGFFFPTSLIGEGAQMQRYNAGDPSEPALSVPDALVVKNGKVGINKADPSALLHLNGDFNFEISDSDPSYVRFSNPNLFIGGSSSTTKNLNVNGNCLIENLDLLTKQISSTGNINIAPDYFMHKGTGFASSIRIGNTDKEKTVPSFTPATELYSLDVGPVSVAQDAGYISFAGGSNDADPDDLCTGSSYKAPEDGKYLVFSKVVICSSRRTGNSGLIQYNLSDLTVEKGGHFNKDKDNGAWESNGYHGAMIEIHVNQQSKINAAFNPTMMDENNNNFANFTISGIVSMKKNDELSIFLGYISNPVTNLRIGDRMLTVIYLGSE